MANRILLCLAASPLDWPTGISLLKLWVDIEPNYNPDVDIGIALRHDMDTATVPDELVAMLKTKFANVFIFKSPLIGSGWPHGCNALETGAYQWFVEATRAGTVQADYIMLCEPDTVPLRPTWIREISAEAYASGGPIIGAYFTAEEGVQHINGNCAIHKDFWKQCQEIWQVPPDRGWDVYIGNKATAIGKPSRLIWQDYRLGAPDNPWKGDDYLWQAKSYGGPNNPLYGESLQPAMFHGIKTLQGIDAVRAKTGLRPRI